MSTPMRGTQGWGVEPDRRCVDSVLSVLVPVFESRRGERDPYLALRALKWENNAPPEQKFLAAELLVVRNAYAHWNLVDADLARWGLDTARLLAAKLDEPAAASHILQIGHKKYPRDPGGCMRSEVSRSAGAIRSDLANVLSGVLRRIISDGQSVGGSPTQVKWPRRLVSAYLDESRAKKRDLIKFSCSEPLRILAEVGFDKDAQGDCGPFGSREVMDWVKACCWELRNSALGYKGGRISGGLLRELMTSQQLLAVMGCTPEREAVSALVSELRSSWRRDPEGNPPIPRMAFATAAHATAWQQITNRADGRGARLFEIIADSGRGKSAFLDELDDHLTSRRFVVLRVEDQMTEDGFISALGDQLDRCPVLEERYRKAVARQVRSCGAGGLDQHHLEKTIYEINVLANVRPVAILLDAPEPTLVRSLLNLLRQLPTALIAYAHRPHRALGIHERVESLRVSHFVFDAMTTDEVEQFVMRIVGAAGDVVARTSHEPVMVESLCDILEVRPNFLLDADDIPGNLRRFVDEQARFMIGRPDGPSVFDRLAVMPRIRNPELLAALLVDDEAACQPKVEVARSLMEWLRHFTFIIDHRELGISVHDYIRQHASTTISVEEKRRLHEAAAVYFGERADLFGAIDENSPWTQWDRTEDPVLRADIRDWLHHLSALGPLSEAVQLRLIRQFLDVFWWYEANTPTDFITELIADYGRLGDYRWLAPLEKLQQEYVPRFEPAPADAPARWSGVRKALAGLQENLPVDDLDAERSDSDRHRIEILVDLIRAAAIWRGRTTDDDLAAAAEALQLYKAAAARAMGMGRSWEWLALWAEAYSADMCAVIDPENTRERVREIEEWANRIGENEVRVLLTDVYGELAWRTGAGDPAAALDCDTRAVLLAYVYQVEQGVEMPPSRYTQALYQSVVDRAMRHLEDVREQDPAVADAAIDRCRRLFGKYWDAFAPDDPGPAAVYDNLFPPGPADADLYRIDTPFVARVRETSADLACVLAQQLDARIDCPDPVSLRRADPEDLTRIFELGSETVVRDVISHRPWMETVVAKALSGAPGSCWVAEADGRLVGFALTSLAELDTSARVEWLGVSDEYRWRGVAYRLVDAVRESARGLARTHLITDVFDDDEYAHRMGFQPAASLYCSTL